MAAPSISTRPIPGTRRSASSIGFLLDAGHLRSVGGVDRLVALLRRARALGVTTFELPSGAGADALERAVATAFPDPDPSLTILSERSSDDLSGRRPAGDPASGGPIATALVDSHRRMRPHSIHLIDWVAREEDDPADLAELSRLVADRKVDAVVHRLGAPSRAEPTPGPGALWSAPVSLLDDRAERRLAGLAETASIGVFARDPLDGGRLDGRRLTDAVGTRRPDAGPVRLRELEQEFAPVLALGFLTEGHRRTLAQAAIRYALRWPWVCSVLVPLPAPERLAEILSAESVPPISDQELERLAAVPRRG